MGYLKPNVVLYYPVLTTINRKCFADIWYFFQICIHLSVPETWPVDKFLTIFIL